ncbi:MAG: HAMP domain-containing sensor histidine kinase [Pseudomonadota bacterium]
MNRSDPNLSLYSLRFRDPDREARYAGGYFPARVLRVRMLLLGVLGFVVGVIALNAYLHESAVLTLLRWSIVLPLLLLSIAATWLVPGNAFYYVLGGMVGASMLLQPVMLFIDPDLAVHLVFTHFGILMAYTVLLSPPFLHVLCIGGSVGGLFAIALTSVPFADEMLRANLLLGVANCAFISTAFAYDRERADRQLFVQFNEVGRLRHQVDLARANQVSWLRGLARYLGNDLRNALFIIRSNLEFLQLRAGKAAQRNVALALAATTDLEVLGGRAADASQLELELPNERAAPINLSQILEDYLLTRVAAFTEDNPLELDLRDDIWVEARRERLVQVFDLLIGDVLNRVDSETHLRVSLHGIAGEAYLGIDNVEPLGELAAEVLQGYNPAKAMPENDRGDVFVGMGLFVSRHIIEHYGGTIDVRSQFGKVVFLVRLPLVDSPTDAKPRVPAAKVPAREKRKI